MIKTFCDLCGSEIGNQAKTFSYPMSYVGTKDKLSASQREQMARTNVTVQLCDSHFDQVMRAAVMEIEKIKSEDLASRLYPGITEKKYES